MNKLFILALATALGVSAMSPSKASAQDKTSTMMTREAELTAAATKLNNDYLAISQAYDAYYLKNKSYPENVIDLVTDGFLETVPAPDCNTLHNCTSDTRYEFNTWGDNDNNGKDDIVLDIIDGGNPDSNLCVTYNNKHTSLGKKPWVNKSLGNKRTDEESYSWPAKDRTFCVCWNDECDVKPASLKLGDMNIITLLSH